MTRVEIPAQELYAAMETTSAVGIAPPLYDLPESVRERYGIPRAYAHSRMMNRYVFLIFFDEDEQEGARA